MRECRGRARSGPGPLSADTAAGGGTPESRSCPAASTVGGESGRCADERHGSGAGTAAAHRVWTAYRYAMLCMMSRWKPLKDETGHGIPLMTEGAVSQTDDGVQVLQVAAVTGMQQSTSQNQVFTPVGKALYYLGVLRAPSSLSR